LRSRPRSSLFPYPTLFRSPLITAEGILRSRPLDFREHLTHAGIVSERRTDRITIASDDRRAVERRRVARADEVRAVRHAGLRIRSEEHTSELQSREKLVCR